ncbi:MAG: hypothetical protein O3B25_16945, partial [Verrucomicrobia bacterium]|nr:hypothetical protein [Verrucomicrobiota bacterium]
EPGEYPLRPLSGGIPKKCFTNTTASVLMNIHLRRDGSLRIESKWNDFGDWVAGKVDATRVDGVLIRQKGRKTPWEACGGNLDAHGEVIDAFGHIARPECRPVAARDRVRPSGRRRCPWRQVWFFDGSRRRSCCDAYGN